jgi:hypothetical protein
LLAARGQMPDPPSASGRLTLRPPGTQEIPADQASYGTPNGTLRPTQAH